VDVAYPRCCGLDIQKKLVVACLLTPGAGGRPHKEGRRFGTMTAELVALADWLRAAPCTHVAMESTGSYWHPIYNVLEEQFTLLLVNAQHIKAVPGRKTDVRDCEWIADLLRHGLLRPSFVPARPQRELRELTRYRTALVQERSAEINRLPKTLEGANIKLAGVASNVLGESGRAMLTALLAGITDPTVLAELAKGRLRAKRAELEQALTGRVGAHQCFLIAEQLGHIDELAERIARVSAEISERLRPVEQALERLDTIPGVGRHTAEVLLAELGSDLQAFPSAPQLASWAGMCPGNRESAGKRQSGKTRKGNPYVRAVLVEAAHAAGHTKDNYLSAQYHRLAGRRGTKKAAVAVGHSILVIVYHLLTRGTTYDELGGNYFDERDRQAVPRRLVRRLEDLGYQVTLEPASPAA
jgi:transposase